MEVMHSEVQAEISRRISVYKTLHPQAALLYMDSVDPVLPLIPSVLQAMRDSVDDPALNHKSPVRGYPFLLRNIVNNDFKKRNIKISTDDIFVSAGVRQDIVGISDILCKDNRLAVLDPTSQIYIKSNVIGYRAGSLEDNLRWSNVVYLSANATNDYMPAIPDERFDVVFLSSPNNPTGVAMNRTVLTKWVNYAIENNVIILFDATYESFVSDSDIPRSIYEIDGASKVAIEFHTFAKNGGFTGMHCGYTVIPQKIMADSLSYGKQVRLSDLWLLRQNVMNNAPSYVLQCAASALYSPTGKAQSQANVDYYMMNAAMLRQALAETPLSFCGGENSPYLWVSSSDKDSWYLFNIFLLEGGIVVIPGEMYGSNPDGCVRISAFAHRKDVVEACQNIRQVWH
jgi:LL-diaminopimelate aminotransferase